MNWFYILGLIVLFGMASCQSEESCDTPPENTTATASSDASELSLLMRDMFADTWKARQAIRKGEAPNLDFAKLKRIHDAVATDPEKVTHPAFATMSDAYLATVKALNATQEAEKRPAVYTRMIQGCETCHKQFCPGPLVRIKKLHLPESNAL